MALTGISRFETIDYVSDQDPAKKQTKVFNNGKDESEGFRMVEEIDRDTATIFKIAPLNVALMARIYDGLQKTSYGENGPTVDMFINETSLDAARFGLRGWENFNDAKGNPIPFKTDKINRKGRSYEVADQASLDALGLQLATELGTKIKEISEVKAEEEKN